MAELLQFFEKFAKFPLTAEEFCIILRLVVESRTLTAAMLIEAWLSLVERCVRDAEVACSNHVASIPACWSSGQDDALSRRKPGFDSRTGHERQAAEYPAACFMKKIYLLL